VHANKLAYFSTSLTFLPAQAQNAEIFHLVIFNRFNILDESWTEKHSRRS